VQAALSFEKVSSAQTSKDSHIVEQSSARTAGTPIHQVSTGQPSAGAQTASPHSPWDSQVLERFAARTGANLELTQEFLDNAGGNLKDALRHWQVMGLGFLPEPPTNAASGGAGRASGHKTSRDEGQTTSRPALADTRAGPTPFPLLSNVKNGRIVDLMTATGQDAEFCRDILESVQYDLSDALKLLCF
jgi:hypothetical protein